jgi:hypothetical protein
LSRIENGAFFQTNLPALSPKNRIITRYPIRIRNIGTIVGFFENRVGVDLIGRTRIFKEQIGEVEIVCQKISFTFTTAYHQVRQSGGYELSELPGTFELIHSSNSCSRISDYKFDITRQSQQTSASQNLGEIARVVLQIMNIKTNELLGYNHGMK